MGMLVISISVSIFVVIFDFKSVLYKNMFLIFGCYGMCLTNKIQINYLINVSRIIKLLIASSLQQNFCRDER